MVMLFTDTIVRLRAPVITGAYGDAERDWANAVEVTIDAVSVQPTFGSGSGETQDGTRDSTTTYWTGYTPLGSGDVDLLVTDRVRYAGRVLEIHGEPRRWPDPRTGGVSKVEWTMREVVG